MERLYTTHDISRLIQVDPSTVSKWIDKGILVAFRTPGGHRRVKSADLRIFLTSHQMPVPPELGNGVIRLLIVDDEKSVLDSLKRAFKPYEDVVDVTTTNSPVEALLLVSEQKPYGMLVDLNMPGLDGLEVCRQIRGRKQLEGVRLITMSSRASAEASNESVKAGAMTCLAKPIDAQQVLDLFKVPITPTAKR